MNRTLTAASDLPGCIVCNAAGAKRWFIKETEAEAYPVHRCGRCGSAFVWPRPAKEHIRQFYAAKGFRRRDTDSPTERLEDILERERIYPNSSIDAESFARDCRRLSPGRRLLDIGAGYGFVTQAALRLGFEVTALEPSPSCRDVFALLNGFAPAAQFLDDDFVREHQNRFDAVVMSQVLEHIADIDLCLRQLRALLAPGAVAVIAVPQFGSLTSLVQQRRDMFIIPPEHLNYFTARGLRRLFARHGFTHLKSTTYSRFDSRKVARSLRPGAAGNFMRGILRSTLHIADRFEKGMYFRGCFRVIK